MLVRIIRTIRQKPKVVRDQYALSIAGGITVIIFFVWFVGLSEVATDVVAIDMQPAESAGVFSSLINEVKNTFAETTQEFQSMTASTTAADTDQSIDMSVVDTLTVPAVSGTATATATQPAAVRIATTSATGTAVGQ